MASALQGARLSAYEEALRELGCSEVEDLGIVEDEALQTIGMKVIVSGPAQALLRFKVPHYCVVRDEHRRSGACDSW